jgi:hypothetical protein
MFGVFSYEKNVVVHPCSKATVDLKFLLKVREDLVSYQIETLDTTLQDSIR